MIDKRELLEKLFRKKCEIKGIRFSSVEQIFSDNLESALSPYWNQELGRLLNPLPDLYSVLEDLKAMLKFLEGRELNNYPIYE